MLVADVHTYINSRQVLEEAVGYMDMILVVYPVDNSYRLAAEPVFSYL